MQHRSKSRRISAKRQSKDSHRALASARLHSAQYTTEHAYAKTITATVLVLMALSIMTALLMHLPSVLQTYIGASSAQSLSNPVLRYSLLNSSSVLGTLPDPSAFHGYVSTASPVVMKGFLGSEYYLFYAYETNFTAPAYSASAIPPSYRLAKPSNYSLSGYPLGVDVGLFAYSDASSAASAFNLHFYNRTFSGSPSPDHNYSVEIHIAPNGELVFTPSAATAYMYNSTFTFNHTTINGQPAVIEKLAPIYTNYEQYRIMFKEGAYIAQIDVLGLNGTLNASYAINIAKSMAASLAQ